mmetsp:Transcript_19163/g.43965  ORF Transcript_19163/g.43965 Transcript_19163/m.43965 type:complete len:372 (-) Transcript_19163:903-2018(-)
MHEQPLLDTVAEAHHLPQAGRLVVVTGKPLHSSVELARVVVLFDAQVVHLVPPRVLLVKKLFHNPQIISDGKREFSYPVVSRERHGNHSRCDISEVQIVFLILIPPPVARHNLPWGVEQSVLNFPQRLILGFYPCRSCRCEMTDPTSSLLRCAGSQDDLLPLRALMDVDEERIPVVLCCGFLHLPRLFEVDDGKWVMTFSVELFQRVTLDDGVQVAEGDRTAGFPLADVVEISDPIQDQQAFFSSVVLPLELLLGRPVNVSLVDEPPRLQQLLSDEACLPPLVVGFMIFCREVALHHSLIPRCRPVLHRMRGFFSLCKQFIHDFKTKEHELSVIMLALSFRAVVLDRIQLQRRRFPQSFAFDFSLLIASIC